MTESREFLQWLVAALDHTGIAYMICGSCASTFHGEHRATNDVDAVVDPTLSQLNAFLESLGEDVYVNPTTAREALHQHSMFNLIDVGSGFKADLIIRKDRPFSIEEFRRRERVDMLGITLYVSSAEDAILSKLEWAKAGESERQLRDAVGVAVVQWEKLDRQYLQRWSRELNVQALLERLLDEAQKHLPSD